MEDRVKVSLDPQKIGTRKKLADLLAEVYSPVSKEQADELLKSLRDQYGIKYLPDPVSSYNGVPGSLPVRTVQREPSHLTDQHLIDAMKYLSQAQAQVRHTTTVREKTLCDFSNAEIVMEMLARGFAVMKLPEDGGPPEALRDKSNEG